MSWITQASSHHCLRGGTLSHTTQESCKWALKGFAWGHSLCAREALKRDLMSRSVTINVQWTAIGAGEINRSHSQGRMWAREGTASERLTPSLNVNILAIHSNAFQRVSAVTASLVSLPGSWRGGGKEGERCQAIHPSFCDWARCRRGPYSIHYSL